MYFAISKCFDVSLATWVVYIPYLTVGQTLPRFFLFPFIITIHLIIKQFLKNAKDFAIHEGWSERHADSYSLCKLNFILLVYYICSPNFKCICDLGRWERMYVCTCNFTLNRKTQSVMTIRCVQLAEQLKVVKTELVNLPCPCLEDSWEIFFCFSFSMCHNMQACSFHETETACTSALLSQMFLSWVQWFLYLNCCSHQWWLSHQVLWLLDWFLYLQQWYRV